MSETKTCIVLFREYDPLAGKRKYRIRIQAVEQRWNAIELAKVCTESWKKFVNEKIGLKLPDFLA